MGLDLILESKNKKYYGDDDWHELAYGRKTWDIADFFRDRNEPIEDDWLYYVTRESWDAFIAVVNRYATDPVFLNAFNHIKHYNDSETGAEPTEAEYNQLHALLEDITPEWYAQLGVEWETRAIIRWYNANPIVQDAFNRNDEIRLVVSY